MNIQFLTELPTWWVLICLAAGFLYALVLYRKDHSFDSIHPWLKRLLFGLRAVLVFFLALLLLTPLLKTLTREKEKPVIIIAQDNSQSIVINKDSSFYRNEYKKQLTDFANGLKEKFDVKEVNWGDKVSDGIDFSFSEKQTDFSALFSQINDRYEDRNVGAVIIAGDGLYNRGSSPVYDESILKVPYFTIALGDTTVQKDLLISKVNFNKTVYLGNSFPIEVTVDARRLSGASSVLTIKQDSSVLFSKQISISGNKFNQLIPVVLDAKKTGIIHYKIELSAVAGEMSTMNNIRDIYVEVIESKQKVLVVGNSPHPDLGAIKLSLESSQNYTVKVVMAEAFEGNLSEYNLVILHNLPSTGHPIKELLGKISASSIPTWYILGTQVSIPMFNALGSGINITNNIDKSNPVEAKVNRDFSLFTISSQMEQNISSFPALLTPFGKYRSTANNAVLLYQQIGDITTDQPLQIFNQSTGQRIGVLGGEGIWKWRLSDYSANGNFDAFNEWLLKSVQNLSVKENKTHFRLISKNNINENEQVVFDAEVYNDNYELINTPDVNMVITNSAGKSFPYIFSKTEKGYNLNSGFMSAGDYKYKSTVKVSDKVYTSSGQFTVSLLQAEQGESVADHVLLNTLAQKNGGAMFYPNQLNELKDQLLKRDDMKTVSYSHYKLRDLVDVKAIFFILLALLSIEWFLRKRAGSY
ncbi:MAG: hypothetical protein IPN88_11920 [Bacteroidetes bacterium]|nr:hypothetical protein [Bacteroidota bacterium]